MGPRLRKRCDVIAPDVEIEAVVTPGRYRALFADGFVVDVVTAFGNSQMIAGLVDRFGEQHGVIKGSTELVVPAVVWADRLVHDA